MTVPRSPLERGSSPFRNRHRQWKKAPLNPVRVVLADDHRPTLEVVARLLEPHFEVVAAVGDGAALLEAVEQHDPDLVVLDISMPVMDGIQAARRLTASGAKVKLVFLTIHQNDDFARLCVEAGAVGYVVKSRMATDLPVAVAEALAGRTFVSGG